MSNEHVAKSSRATIGSADDPSIFGAHHLGVVGDRRHCDFGVPPLEQVEREHAVSLSPKMRRRSRR